MTKRSVDSFFSCLLRILGKQTQRGFAGDFDETLPYPYHFIAAIPSPSSIQKIIFLFTKRFLSLRFRHFLCDGRKIEKCFVLILFSKMYVFETNTFVPALATLALKN
jgi:hypothetical protein